MKILLTGGTGFIGKQLLPLLRRKNHKVLVLGRNPQSDVVVDLTQISEKAEASILDFNPEACIHLAWQGIPDYSIENCRRNHDSSLRLFQLLTRTQCGKILGAGSCWEYGELRGCVKEQDVAQDLNAFATFKTSLRLELEKIAKNSSMSSIWARIFFVYGPGQRDEALIPSTIRKIRAHTRPEIRNPNVQNDFVYVGDVANGLAGLVEAPQVSGIYNIGSGRPLRVGEVVQELYRVVRPEEDYSFVKEDQLQDAFWADITQLTKATGWEPEIDLRRGLEFTYKALI